MKSMNRRKFMQSLFLLTAIAALPKLAFARAVPAFSSSTVDDVLKQLLGDMPIEVSDKIVFKIPEIAENGAVVPVSVSTKIEGVDRIYLLVDNNPNPLSAVFEISGRTLPDISTRVKVGESSMARAVVRANGRAYMTSKEVKVTIGGCGG